MEINADFNTRVVMHGNDMPWVTSPVEGVQRRMLDRIGAEVARATTIVRYEPNSQFSPHIHTGGEEFLVLEGVFQDEHGDFPAGSYIRNPPESSHTPGSKQGCVIFVKLWQFDLKDRHHVRLQSNDLHRVASGTHPQIDVVPLFADDHETVEIQYWPANQHIEFLAAGGAELLLLDGEVQESGDILRYQSWLRVPPGYRIKGTTGDSDVKLWVKTGHLKNPRIPKAIQEE